MILKHWKRAVALMLALVLALGALTSCQIPIGKQMGTTTTADGEDETPESTTTGKGTTTGDDTSQPTTTTTPSATTEPILPDDDGPVPAGKVRITAVNGKHADGRGSVDYDKGATVVLTAAEPANGYLFSYWANSAGERVSTNKSLTLTATADATYKAYYEVWIGNNRGTAIYTDIENDWTQGGVKGRFDGWQMDYTRICFKEPYLLKKGETMKVYLPQVECLFNPGACPDKDEVAGDCTIASAIVEVSPKSGSATGDISKDYTIVSGQWRTTMTATKDTYVVVTVKWTNHGNEPVWLSDDYVKEIVVTIEDKSTKGASPVGSYWESELEAGVARIEAERASSVNGLSEFFFISDVHWLNNAQSSPALINYLAKELDADTVLVGGNVIKDRNVSRQNAIDKEINAFFHALDGYTKTGESLKILSTVGYHDRNGVGSSNALISEQTVYELFVKRTEELGGMTIANDPNQSCFDDTANKVRYIQFFTAEKYDATTAQYTSKALDWVEARIKELGADWTVVLLSSAYCAYDSKTGKLEPCAENVAYKDRILSIKKDAAADIACWLVGGAHLDYTEELTSTASDETLRLIAFGSDSYQNSMKATYSGEKNDKMAKNTVTEQSFGFVQIDPILKKITVTRFGVGDDESYTYADNTVTVKVTNGTVDGEVSEGRYPIGDKITLVAAKGPRGFCFSHWENADGETVGTSQTLAVTVSQAAQYKAYYEYDFDETGAPTVIALNTKTDWIQGGVKGKFDGWQMDSTRVCLATPYLLRAGETLTINLPAVQCLITPGDCPKLEGVGDCTLTAAVVELSKVSGSATGDFKQDYTIIKGNWKMSHTATVDTYVMITVKWDKHGGEDFLLDGDLHKQIKVTVSTPQDATLKGDALGYYWLEEMEDAVETIEKNREKYGSMSEFIYLTDPHWFGDSRTQYSPALVNYISEMTNNNFLAFGGDIIHGTPSRSGAIAEITTFFNALTGYTKMGESLRIMATLGNHDRNYLTDHTDHTLDEQTAYELYAKRMEGWGVTQGDANASYYDDTAHKVRYIQFFYTSSSTALPEDQYIDESLDWAETRIRELSADWTVVLFTHGILGGKTEDNSSYSAKDREIAYRLLTIQKEADAEIACWLVGHNHIDRYEVFEAEDGVTQLHVMSSTSDGYPDNSYINSTSEQSFSYVQVDTVNKKVYLTRIGRGEDRVINYGAVADGTHFFYGN